MFVFVGLAFILFGALLVAFAVRITVNRPARRRYVRLLGALSVLTGIVTLLLH